MSYLLCNLLNCTFGAQILAVRVSLTKFYRLTLGGQIAAGVPRWSYSWMVVYTLMLIKFTNRDVKLSNQTLIFSPHKLLGQLATNTCDIFSYRFQTEAICSSHMWAAAAAASASSSAHWAGARAQDFLVWDRRGGCFCCNAKYGFKNKTLSFSS